MDNLIKKLEHQVGFTLPPKYKQFVISFSQKDKTHYPFELIYPLEDIIERNETYAIQLDEPDCLLIGQEGDSGFFIRKTHNDSIFSLDLGALGSLSMYYEADNIEDFLTKKSQML